MADNRPAEAVDVVARWALSTAFNWSDFPELSAADFQAVCVQAALLVASPSLDEYEAAYSFLTARADAAT